MKLTTCLTIAALMTGCASQHSSLGPPRDARLVAMNEQIDATHIRATIEKLVSFKTRHTLSTTQSTTEGIGAAREWIKSQFEQYAADSGGRLKAEFQEVKVEKSARVPNATTVVNVLATLKGDDNSNRVLVISGHYDSRALGVADTTSDAPGANDDGSGTALVMELARVMSKQHFGATIVFACVAGEEQNLLGAAGLAEKLHDDDQYVEAMLDNDIVGNSTGGNGVHDASRVRVFSEGVPTSESAVQMQNRQSIGGENDGASRQLARYIQCVADANVPGFKVSLVFRRDRYGRGGDHIPFLRHGDAAVRFTEPNEDFSRQHQNVTMKNGKPYGDVPAFVDFDYIANVARVNCVALATLARAPSPPRSVMIDGGLSYDAKIEWLASEGGRVASYAVLVRATTSSIWEKRIDVGKATNATLPFSKDDYMFAVEAIGPDGSRSLPVVPLTKR